MPGREAMLFALLQVLEPQLKKHKTASYFIDAGAG